MSPELLRASVSPAAPTEAAPLPRPVEGPDSEYGLLKEVLLASPRNLSIVPCNRVSEDALEKGQSSCSVTASRQHRDLVETLMAAGVRVRTVQPVADLPDLAFTRDTSLMTPWGLIGLRPGLAHRRGEVEVVLDTARGAGVPVLGRVERGSVEGGDVCLLRSGHLVIGVSEKRTTTEGARALGSFFEREGWKVTLVPIDPDLLHLDTHFCLADRDVALACVEKLDPAFVAMIRDLGIDIVPVRADEIASLGCNVLSLGRRRIISTGSAPRVDQAVRELGFEVLTVPLGEFTQCGGGVHCLTMPLRRQSAAL
ncbi:dimethylarginine dimethylaminohydrolase family protein [Sphingomonas glaciei]|uniref:arginine deiminase n=1 Tax=Sphingomonas glaciei TaxID=2938948 RepID=A0ABY5MW50_9SPHN|nr:arginine deiminase family protein [Sphingomonas glaciei]UUR08211.1 arginine deiminase family protein [Sphingomonas glaciei]